MLADNSCFEDAYFDDGCSDCADEGTVLDGPATLLRALIEIEPAQPAFKSAIWRGLVASGALYHRADSLAGLAPETC
jgi:hypothetical protein